MASERKPALSVVDTLKDKHGRTVKVGHRGGDIEIIVTPHSGHDGRIALDQDTRDQFIRAYAEAERQAERFMCATPDDCLNGPEAHAFRRDDGTETALPCCRQPWEEEARDGD